MSVPRWIMAVAIGAALFLCAVPQIRAEKLQRPMIQVGVTTMGYHGGYLRTGDENFLLYPSNLRRPGGYGDNKLKGTAEHLAYYMRQRAGHGVWSFTSDQVVIYTGPRRDKDDLLVPMQYDVSAHPELSKLGRGGVNRPYILFRPRVQMGNGEPFPAGLDETSLGGNWWPGSELIEEWKRTGDIRAVHINNFNLSEYPSVDEWPEEMIAVKWTNAQGLTFTERVSGWSHPDFDDFFLDEYIIENTGDKNGDGEPDGPVLDQRDVYIGFMDRFALSAAGAHSQWGAYWREERTFIMDDWYTYDATLKLLFSWDGDHPLYGDWDDTGDPYKDAFAFKRLGQPENTLMSPMHLGVGVIAYTDDPTSPYGFNARDRNQGYIAPRGDQPFAVRYWESFSNSVQDDPRGETTSDPEMYSSIVGSGPQITEGKPSVVPSGQFSMLVFGPYDLPPGGKAKIVLAYAGGHPGQMLGNTDMWTWAFKGNQAELPKGLDALKQNIEAAQFAYDNAFDIPDAPPDVNFRSGSSPDAQMQLEWSADIENAVHPDYGTNDIAGYRVYRSTWFDIGPWELIADFKVGETPDETGYKVERNGAGYVFTDKNSVAGFFYHYSVRAYQMPHAGWTSGSSDPTLHPLSMADLPSHIASRLQVGQEGGWSAQTQRIYASESPFAVPSGESDASEARVRVVPNPYIGSGFASVVGEESHSYGGAPKIRFVGIPSHCRIRIFSVSGELVGDITHTDRNKGETDYDQLSWNNLTEIATGVYFYVVENLIDGADKGKIQRGTFMIVR